MSSWAIQSGVIRLLPSAVLVSTCFFRRFWKGTNSTLLTYALLIKICVLSSWLLRYAYLMYQKAVFRLNKCYRSLTFCVCSVPLQPPTFLMSSRDSPFMTLLSLGADDSVPALPGPELAWAEFCRSCWYFSISGFSMMVVESWASVLVIARLFP